MDEPTKRSNELEQAMSKILVVGGGGVLGLFLGWLVVKYGDWFQHIGWLLVIGGGLALLYALYGYLQTRSIPSFPVTCPYCNQDTEFTAPPARDFACDHCMKLVQIENGKVVDAKQIKCPNCGSMQRISARATTGICEECNREMNISKAQRVVAVDENAPHELVLTGVGRHPDRVIMILESMLSLNRLDVKKLLETLPIVLFTNVTKRKAEMTRFELVEAGAITEIRPLAQAQAEEAPDWLKLPPT